MSVIGTMGNDTLSQQYGSADFYAGLAGNDTIDIRYQSGVTYAFGGSGDDTYVLTGGSTLIIADSGGNDTLVLQSFTAQKFIEYANFPFPSTYSAVLDGKDFYCEIPTLRELGVKDFLGQGKIETIKFSDGVTMSVDSLWNQFKGNAEKVSFSDLDFTYRNMVTNGNALYNTATALEGVYAANPVASWFDDATYMLNKGKQAGMSQDGLTKAFISAGYYGENGDYLHFLQHGQWEDVSPTKYFDADYYYRSKAADYNSISLSKVTAAQAKEMRDAIHNAGMNAWTHYQLHGTREGIDPSAQFDTSAYMAAKLAQMRQSDPTYTMNQLNLAFIDAGFSAVTHYEAHGKDEGIALVGVKSIAFDMPMENILDAGA